MPEGREMDLGEFLAASMLPESHGARREYAVLNDIRNHPWRHCWWLLRRKTRHAFQGYGWT